MVILQNLPTLLQQLASLIAVTCFFPCCCFAQQINVVVLSELLVSATDIAGSDWIVDYDGETRTVTCNSVGTILGENFDSGHPKGSLAEYPIRIRFRVVSVQAENQKSKLDSLVAAKLKFEERMSPNTLSRAGLIKLSATALSKAEWIEYLEYQELQREIDLLTLPTHQFKSLLFVDCSGWNIRPATNQKEAANRLLAQHEKLLKLLTKVK